jgi:hypothetical protein
LFEKKTNQGIRGELLLTRLITGKDGVVRGAVVKTGKGKLERAVQHLFPLELSCDLNNNPQLNPDATDFHPRESC